MKLSRNGSGLQLTSRFEPSNSGNKVPKGHLLVVRPEQCLPAAGQPG